MDTDGNGKPEVFVCGQTIGAATIVYESSGPDALQAVDSFFVTDNTVGVEWNGLAELDPTEPLGGLHHVRIDDERIFDVRDLRSARSSSDSAARPAWFDGIRRARARVGSLLGAVQRGPRMARWVVTK